MSFYTIDECSLSTINVDKYTQNIDLLNKLEEVEKSQTSLINKFDLIIGSLNKFFSKKKNNSMRINKRKRIKKNERKIFVKKSYLIDD